MQRVFVSNFQEYTGPGVVKVLSRSGYQVIGHDRSFDDPGTRAEFTQKDNCVPLAAQTPEDFLRISLEWFLARSKKDSWRMWHEVSNPETSESLLIA